MTDTNRPVSFNVYDCLENKVVANYPTHDQALAHCGQIEHFPLLSTGSWRYTVAPVRVVDQAAQDDGRGYSPDYNWGVK